MPTPKSSASARTRKSTTRPPSGEKARCGLCGKTSRLTRTECCGQWICDDEGGYVMFSYARNSCSRNHRRYTLCGYHHVEGHGGDWRECQECRESFDTEMYVHLGTNEYNFVKLENPPSFEPTRCASCGKRIDLGHDPFSMSSDGYSCVNCLGKKLGGRIG